MTHTDELQMIFGKQVSRTALSSAMFGNGCIVARIPTFRVPGETSSVKLWKMPVFLSLSVLPLSSVCTVSIPFQFLEVQAQHAFIRDESSKGRWDAALTRSLFSFMMEVFERTVGRDLGPKIERSEGVQHVC